jgi:hypothetical protein
MLKGAPAQDPRIPKVSSPGRWQPWADATEFVNICSVFFQE